MAVPPSAGLVGALSQRLRNIADLVESKASDIDTSAYEQLDAALVDWEKFLRNVKPSIEKESVASPRLSPRSQNNAEAASEREEGNAGGRTLKGKNASKKAEKRAAQKKQSDVPAGLFAEAVPLPWKLFPPFVLLMRAQEDPAVSLRTKGQPHYIKVPEEILRAESPVLALLLDRKQLTNIDAADLLAYDPEHTQKLKQNISDKLIYIIAAIETPFGDISSRNEISKMAEPNQWRAVCCWGKYITSGPPGKRTFSKPVGLTLKEDLKVLAGFLRCGYEFVDAIEKAYEQGEEERRQRIFVQRKPSMEFKRKP